MDLQHLATAIEESLEKECKTHGQSTEISDNRGSWFFKTHDGVSGFVSYEDNSEDIKIQTVSIALEIGAIRSDASADELESLLFLNASFLTGSLCIFNIKNGKGLYVIARFRAEDYEPRDFKMHINALLREASTLLKVGPHTHILSKLKEIISDDLLVHYCSLLTGKKIKKLGNIVKRNRLREKDAAESEAKIGGSLIVERKYYDLDLNYEGRDSVAGYELHNELVLLKLHYYRDDPLPTAQLEINSEERWGDWGITIALNKMSDPDCTDVFKKEHSLKTTDIERACEVAKWMVCEGSDASTAHKLVDRLNYQPVPPLTMKDILNRYKNDLDNL